MILVVTAPRASDLPPDDLDGIIARDLVALTERLADNGVAIEAGALGGRFGYGAAFENAVFVMRPFCWCGREEGPNACPTCVDQCSDDPAEKKSPHFAVKGSAIEVRWYKWIGRSMEIAPADLTAVAWRVAFAFVMASVPRA